MPGLKELETNARINEKKWEEFKETEKQMEIYALRTKEQLEAREKKKKETNLQDEEDCTLTPANL